MQPLSEQQLQNICNILADTDRGLSKTEIKNILHNCGIGEFDDGSRTINNGMVYQIGLNKRNWLYKCFVADINKHRTYTKVFKFIESALSPINYTLEEKREKYLWMLNEINKVLLLLGMQVGNDGKLQQVEKASTLDEVDRRVDRLKKKLYERAIHSEVTKYCEKDYLRKDYFDAVFEAAKGLGERVREISGLTSDGGDLFQQAFSKNDPYIIFNSMKTKSEISEFQGLKELLEAIYHLVRNPTAHTPKINWKVEETKALDVLTLISFAHKYLDECYRVPNK